MWRSTTVGMWAVAGLLLYVAAAVGMLPLGWAALVLQVIGLAMVSVVVVWPEIFAQQLRIDDDAGIRGRDRPAVIVYLPVVVALFSLPFYLLAQATLFWRVGDLTHGFLPVQGWADAWRLSLDNLLFTELFFDIFDVFGVGLAQPPAGFWGRLLLFLTRLILSVGFVRIAVSLFRSAYYRALGLGRGGDTLAELDDAVLYRDAARAGYLGRELVAEMHGTINVLLARILDPSAGDSLRRDARDGLRALRDWAIPVLDMRVAHGYPSATEYEQLATDLRQEWAGTASDPPRARPLRAVAMVAGVAAVTALVILGPALPALAVGVALMIVLVWLMASPRSTYEAAVEWGFVPLVEVSGLRRAVALSSCLLAGMFLFVSWATLWQAVTVWPDSFAGVDPAAGRRSLLGFVGASLVRVQATASIPDVFRVAESSVEQRPFMGSALTLVLRTGLNLGFVAVVLTGLSLRRDREGLAGLLQVPDSLAMRMEATRGGRYSFHLIEHHSMQEGNRLWDALDEADDADTREALASSGAFDWCVLYDSLQEAVTPQRLRSQALVIEALDRQGWGVKRFCAELDQALVSGTWPALTKAQVLAYRAAVAAGTGDVAGATVRFAEAWNLLPAGSPAEWQGEAREAGAVWARCALRAAATMPFEGLTDGTATALTERAEDLTAGLASADAERFTIDVLRLASLRAPLLALAGEPAAGLGELESAATTALGLTSKHPWREALIVQLLVSTAVMSALTTDHDGGQATSEIELRLVDDLGVDPDDWRADTVPTRASAEPLGTELARVAFLLVALPASRRSFAAARRAAAVFDAKAARTGLAFARFTAGAVNAHAVKVAHQLRAHEDVIATAADVFRLYSGLRGDPHKDRPLADTHAYCALAHRALGDESAAYEQASLAREFYTAIAGSGREDADAAVAAGSALLGGFGLAPPTLDDSG